MRTPRRPDGRHLLLLAAVAGALGTILVVAGRSGTTSAAVPGAPVSWQGLVGAPQRPNVVVGQRMLVVLETPSLADRVAAAGGHATDREERRWTRAALAQQRLLFSRMEVQGVRIQPEYTFTRVLSGFSAALDPRAIALLERDDSVQGVYPVRVAYPTALSTSSIERGGFADMLARMPGLALPGYDGRGVTVALLDTGVDRTHPFLRGSVLRGIDVVDPTGDATPGANPDAPAQRERHGTQLAGILVGANGSEILGGVAPGASVLPIRVAGWQPDVRGRYGVYARTDQLVAGLERAVDPNDDGDAHDAVRIALLGVAAPFAGFADDAAARAVAGALRLQTLVVAPAGNDGAAGPGFGSIAGPGGAPAALTVSAADTREAAATIRVTLRSGLDVALDRMLPLVGAASEAPAGNLSVAAPALARPNVSFDRLESFFTRDGLSLVAGRAALVPAGDAPAAVAENAARAGAAAVLLYGSRLPAGGIGVDEHTAVPVVGVPLAAAASVLNAVGRDADVGASFGTPQTVANDADGTVATFASTGLAFDGRVKPDLVAPGVGVATADVGTVDDGAPRYATINGSSAAAASVAGAAAVLAQARPSLHASALRSLLVGSAQPLEGETATSEGAGFVSLGAAAAGELAVEPATLALGHASTARWARLRKIVVTNVSSRKVRVGIRIERDREGAASVRFVAGPPRFELAPGQAQAVLLLVRVASTPVGRAAAEGALRIRANGGTPVRVPWAVTFGDPPKTLLGPLHLRTDHFKPSDSAPALLTFQAGRILGFGGRRQLQPLRQLELQLLRGDGTELGTLARLRSLLPGRYAFGLTGRSPAGNSLGRGRYFLRVIAYPEAPGPATRKQVPFWIE
jgi:subtilisin family serine protease